MRITQPRIDQNNLFTSHVRSSPKIRIKRRFKLLIIMLLSICFILYKFLYQVHPRKVCLVDQLHQLTFPLNRWINKYCSHVFIGIGQVLIDMMVVIASLTWIIWTKNYRMPITASAFYFIRSIIMRYTTMPYTSYVVWQHPGFPSLTVPYDHTSDYFFSGHTGAAVLFFLQMRTLKAHFLIQLFGFLSIVFMMHMLIIVRVHYTIDVYAAVFYATQIYTLVSTNLAIGDSIMSVPYDIIRLIVTKIKSLFAEDEDSKYEGTSLLDVGQKK